MDLLEAQSRIAGALVESIFRRALYEVEPYRAGQASLRVGREDFSPDFRACPGGDDGGAGEMLVEVKYRPAIDQFISVENQRGERSVFLLTRRHWPALYFVLVTDRPEPGRSCFQAVAFNRLRAGEPFRTVDLDQLEELKIFHANVADHEQLCRRIMGLLAGV